MHLRMSRWNVVGKVLYLTYQISCVARIHLLCVYHDPHLHLKWNTSHQLGKERENSSYFSPPHTWRLWGSVGSVSPKTYWLAGCPRHRKTGHAAHPTEPFSLKACSSPSATTHNMRVAYIITLPTATRVKVKSAVCPNMTWPREHWLRRLLVTGWVAN